MRTTTSAQPTVRRLIVYTLLLALVSIAAGGLSGLLGRLLESGSDLAGGGQSGLATSLAFTVVGGPLAGLLWWLASRRLRDENERASLAWGLYLAALATLSLIVFSTNLLTTVVALPTGRWESGSFATGLVWALVWVWATRLWRNAETSPGRLFAVPPVLGSVFGLALAVGGFSSALGTLLDTALHAGVEIGVGSPWWRPALQALIWGAGGAAIWWWHWFRADARRRPSATGNVFLVLSGILAACLLTLGSAGIVLYGLLRLATEPAGADAEVLATLGPALAMTAVAGLVWSYHHRAVSARPAATRRAAALAVAGVALVGTATGIGVIVNALLSAAATPLAGGDSRSLLLGGISSLLVGGPIWWRVWKPTAPASPDQAAPGRRVYLVVVFGLSAIVAVITLLVIGFQLFEVVLDGASGGSLLDGVRAPLGLLTATALVAGYHFTVWRRGRPADAPGTDASTRPATVGQLLLVTPGNGGDGGEAQANALRALTGAVVTVWLRADPTGPEVPAPGGGPDSEQLARVLAGVTARRLLVVIGPGTTVEAIPLRD